MSMHRLLPFLTILFAIGCATGQSGEREARSSANVVTAEELEAATESNMYDFVRSRRPGWFQRARPTTIAGAGGSHPLLVYMDGTRLGAIESLRTVTPSSLRLARFLSSSEAQLRFGTGHLNGAIELLTRR